jgi:hypothetical protein
MMEYDSLDKRGRLLADLRALAHGSGHSHRIVGDAADELEMMWGMEAQRLEQAEENIKLTAGGPDKLLKARACVALLNSAGLLRGGDRRDYLADLLHPHSP